MTETTGTPGTTDAATPVTDLSYEQARDELVALCELLVSQDIRPVVDSVFGLDRAEAAYRRLASGQAFGKIVFDHTMEA